MYRSHQVMSSLVLIMRRIGRGEKSREERLGNLLPQQRLDDPFLVPSIEGVVQSGPDIEAGLVLLSPSPCAIMLQIESRLVDACRRDAGLLLMTRSENRGGRVRPDLSQLDRAAVSALGRRRGTRQREVVHDGRMPYGKRPGGLEEHLVA